MLHWIHDYLDRQAAILEEKGIGIIVPIFCINILIASAFAKIDMSQGADLIKNIILALCGCVVAVCGATNMIMGTIQRIRKFRKGKDITDREKTA